MPKVNIKVKNLHGQEFTIECDPEDTVKSAMNTIAEKPDTPEKYDPNLFKLIYKGKVLEEDDSIESYKISPDGFLVLCKLKTPRPKPPPKQQPNPYAYNSAYGGYPSAFGMGPMSGSLMPNSFGHDTLIQPLQMTPHIRPAFPQNLQSPALNPGLTMQPRMPSYPTSNYSTNQSTPYEPPVYVPEPDNQEENLQQLLVMGFDQADAKKALRASANILDLAIDFLTSGSIPEVNNDTTPASATVPAAEPAPLPAAVPTPAAVPAPVPAPNQTTANPNSQSSSSSSSVHRTEGNEDLGVNFQQLTQILQQNPEQLQALKHIIAEQNPAMAKMIEENPQGFLDLLKEAGQNDAAPGESPASGVTPNTNTITVHLSYQEQQIIDRFQDMGFDRNRAIEAFLTCDRNEEMAINYLLNFD